MPNENLVSAESSTATSIAGSSGLAQHRKTKRGSCEEQGTQKSQRRAPLLDVSNVPAHEAPVSTPIHDASSPLDGGFFDIDRAHDPFSMGEYDPEIDENHRIAEVRAFFAISTDSVEPRPGPAPWFSCVTEKLPAERVVHGEYPTRD